MSSVARIHLCVTHDFLCYAYNYAYNCTGYLTCYIRVHIGHLLTIFYNSFKENVINVFHVCKNVQVSVYIYESVMHMYMYVQIHLRVYICICIQGTSSELVHICSVCVCHFGSGSPMKLVQFPLLIA